MMLNLEHAPSKQKTDQISLVFVNGVYAEEMSDIRLLPENTLYQSFATDELILSIPKNYISEKPIHFLFIGAPSNYARSSACKIIAHENSEVVLVEEHVSREVDSGTSVSINLLAHPNAQVDYYKVQNKNELASHTANMIVEQKQDSQVRAFFLMKGTQVIRQDIQVNLAERGAECELYGIYILEQDNQKIYCDVYVEHNASHTNSKILFKGTLSKKSYAAFNGKVFVHQNAQKVDAEQQNHNLLLSNEAEISTKPELEVYADDIKCSHGATIGQIDEEALFYLQARGIEKKDAMHLLTKAFSSEIFDVMKHSSIKKYLYQRINKHEKH